MRRWFFTILMLALPVAAIPARAQTPGHVRTDPHWLKTPTAEEAAKYYPTKAGHEGGAAKIRCIVAVSGALENCALVSETPEGQGFGTAALSMTPLFLMQPGTVDGVPVGGGAVNIPIRFAYPPDPDAGHVIVDARILKSPTTDEIAKYMSPAAGGGTARLQCDVTLPGALENCRVLDETPGGLGFGAAALSVAPLFVMQPKTRDGVPIADAPVIVPLQFAGTADLDRTAGRTVTDAHVIRSPTSEEMAQLLPGKSWREAGTARMKCVVTIAGTLVDCTLLNETPEGGGFGKAALAAAPLFLLQPRTVDGVPVGGASMILPLQFHAASTQPEDAGHVITNPHWLKLPTEDDMGNYWPANGLHEGAAKLRCAVTVRGTLDKCSVVSESPEGAGFGGAALLMAPLFLMEPRTVDGTPVGGAFVNIPIRFKGGASATPPNARIKVANGLAWSAAPTAAELVAAFPKSAGGKTAKAHVVLRCAVGHDGGVRDCDTMTEQPASLGFARAARDLSKRFRIFDDPDYAKQVKDYYVDIPFDFHDPAQPAPPLELLNPIWLETADPAMAGKLFPEAAAKAGLTTGRATLTCQAQHDGTLTGCVVAEELPPGLGFGQAALAIAAVMKMNLWTPQGFPVDGAKIRLPIRVNLNAPAPASGR